jgi:phenylacetic acid degradation operon negative regulatory protein
MERMSEPEKEQATAGAHRSRTVVVSFLGAVVRRMGDWMPIAGTVDLMTQLGLDAPSVRTAVFRLKQRGWLAAETRGGVRGYALTPLAASALAAGDEIIWHARQPADLADGWCVINFSVPESARAKRHQLRGHLSHLGFGNVGTAMWIAPARLRPAAEQAIAELGLDKYAAIFVGDYVGGQDLTTLLYSSWDLARIDQAYRDFTARYADAAAALEAQAAISPQQAFVTYLGVIDSWRKLPYHDPGLPRELLAADWSAPAAGALFQKLVAILEGRALAHAAGYWPTADRSARDRSLSSSFSYLKVTVLAAAGTGSWAAGSLSRRTTPVPSVG